MPDYAVDWDAEDVILLRLGALLEQPPEPTAVAEVESPDCPRCGALMHVVLTPGGLWPHQYECPCGLIVAVPSEGQR